MTIVGSRDRHEPQWHRSRANAWLAVVRKLLVSPFRIVRELASRRRLQRQMHAVRFAALTDGAISSGRTRPAPIFPAVDSRLGPGLNIHGYLHGQFGLGESARQYARALLQAGYPASLADAGIAIPHACNDQSLTPLMNADMPHSVNLVFVNPDHFAEVQPRLPADGYTIGFWFWELDSIPSDWTKAIDAVDEVWVATEFVEQAFRRATTKPVIRIPHPIQPVDGPALARSCFDLEEEAFVFLCSFDFNSSIHRKNPVAVIDAFILAFPDPTANVQLLIKTSNGHRHLRHLEQLCQHAAQDRRILVRDQVLSAGEVSALQHAANAYVSLHRAEGLGLGMAESMAIGKPVIATAWSGNLDFMDEQNSCLVPSRLIPVEDGQYPHTAGAQWAEADVAAAAEWMVRLESSPSLCREKGERARHAITQLMSFDAAATAMMARLRALGLKQDSQ